MNYRALAAAAAATALLTAAFTTDNATTTTCAHRGPTPLGAPVTAAERNALPLARTGNVFISVATSRRVHIIDLASGQRTSLDAGIAGAHEVAVSPDGRWGVAADFGNHTGDHDFDGRRLAVFDLHAKRLTRVIDLERYRGPHDLVFTSNTKLLVTTQTTQHVVEVDVASGNVTGAIETHAKGSHTLAVSADGNTAFTANQPEGSISIMDVKTRRHIAKHSIAAGPTEGIGVTPDGREAWMGFNSLGAVVAVDTRTGRIAARINGFEMPERLALSPDGRLAVVTDFRCEVVQVIDVAARRLLGPIAGLEGAGVAKVLPDNRTALVLMLDERVVAMVDLHTRRTIARFDVGDRRPDAAAWGPPDRGLHHDRSVPPYRTSGDARTGGHLP